MFDPSRFDSAFVATSYMLGARDALLVRALPNASDDAQRLYAKLTHSDRRQRAAALAPELAKLVTALDSGRFR